MKRQINENIHLGETVRPFKSLGHSSAIDRTVSDFDKTNQKVKKIKRLINTGEYDADITHYIPRTLDLVFQGMIDKISTV